MHNRTRYQFTKIINFFLILQLKHANKRMINTDSGMGAASENERFLIVVGRQYGSGGRRIGRMIADKLGISYYDKTLLSKAAGKLGYSPTIFSSKDEKRPSLLRSLLSFNYGSTTGVIAETPMSDEKLYEFQSNVIRDICNTESCVIVGRTADYIMRDHPRMLSLFVHAPLEWRGRAVQERELTKDLKEAMAVATRHDRNRESYYNYYTNGDGWGKARNYHLSFDSSRISDETIMKTVCSMLGLNIDQS